MRLLHIIIGLKIGGAERMLEQLVLAQKKSGQECMVVSLTGTGEIGPSLQSAGVPVLALGLSARGFVGPTFRLFKLIREFRPDHVQTWMYHADLIGGLIARLAGVRSVLWGVRTTDPGAGNNPRTFHLMKICARLSKYIPSRIICAANASRLTHIEYGYDAQKMVVIPNGFSLPKADFRIQHANSVRSRIGIHREQMVVGVVGRFNEAKDYRNFVSALRIVAALHPHVRILFVGRDCDQNNSTLLEWLNEANLAEKSTLVGEVEDTKEFLSAMDIYCLSSQSEGFPNVLGEAMAMGLPCVTTDVGDAAYLLGDCGVIVQPKNSAALAQGIEKIVMLSSEERQRWGEMARQRIKKNFTLSRCVERFDEIYRRS